MMKIIVEIKNYNYMRCSIISSQKYPESSIKYKKIKNNDVRCKVKMHQLTKCAQHQGNKV